MEGGIITEKGKEGFQIITKIIDEAEKHDSAQDAALRLSTPRQGEEMRIYI